MNIPIHRVSGVSTVYLGCKQTRGREEEEILWSWPWEVKRRRERLDSGQLLDEIRGKHSLQLVHDVRQRKQNPAEELR